MNINRATSAAYIPPADSLNTVTTLGDSYPLGAVSATDTAIVAADGPSWNPDVISMWEPEPLCFVNEKDWNALKEEVIELRCLVEELLAQPAEKMGDIGDVL